MRKYFICYYRDFANTYSLCYTETAEEEAQAIAQGMERVSRKEAEHKCAEERARRSDNPSFSGYASSVILPFGYDGDWANDHSVEKVGCIIERK